MFAFPPINGQTIEGQKVKLQDSWDDISPRLVIDYKVTPDVMVFGSLAKGYKAGGFNSVQPLSRFDNEDVWNVEGGVKSLFADIGLIVNASVFYYVYYDKQSISLECPAGEVCRYLIDSSDDEAYGLDVDARWQPVDALTLTANLAYIDATYKDYVTPGGVDLSGEPTGEPRWSSSLGASYVWSFGTYGKLDLSAMYAYRGESRCNADSQLQGTCQTSPNFQVGEATNRTDLRLAWSSADDRYGVAAVRDQRVRRPVRDRREQHHGQHVRHAVRVDLGAPCLGRRFPDRVLTLRLSRRLAGRGCAQRAWACSDAAYPCRLLRAAGSGVSRAP